MERDDIDTDKLVRKYLNGCDIDALSMFYNCSKSTIVYRLKKAGVYATVKKLDPEIPGARTLIVNNEDEIEEVRTCYDDPVLLPEWDYNEDDEDLSDCE